MDSLEIAKLDSNTTEIEKDVLREVVFVYNDSSQTVVMKEVKTGIQDNTFIEIIEGLSEEDEVVVAPFQVISKKLKNRQEVQKVNKDELFKN